MNSAHFLAGLSSSLPQYEAPVELGDLTVTLHNLSVSNSTVGLITTGTLQAVDLAIGGLSTAGHAELAAALKILTEAFANTSELAPDRRQAGLEHLSVVAAEATVQPPQRRLSVVRALLADLSTIAKDATVLGGTVSQTLPVILKFFGL